MNSQDLATRLKIILRSEVINGIQHLTGINRIDQYAGGANKGFYKIYQFCIHLAIAAEMIISMQIVIRWRKQ